MNDVEPNTGDAAPPPETLPALSVGAQLRTAREEAKLSLDAAAQVLKFSPRQIEALEADDYAALPGATIVRGFVRSYARLLKLNADTLLRDLEVVAPCAPVEVRPPDNICVASQPGGGRQFSPLAAISIILLLAAALMAAWHYFGPSDSPATATNLVIPAQETVQVTMPVAVQPVIPEENAGALKSDENSVSVSPVLPALHFVFADRSWVEVMDGNKQLLHSSENQGGTNLSLNGQPPFEIVIGNAGKVLLTYRDQPVNLGPHMRADVARLKLE